MKPLQAVGFGLIIVILEARLPFLGGFDAYFDPIGWLIVAYGVHRLPADLAQRTTVVVTAWLAFAASIPLSMPDVVFWLDDEPSVAWAVNLPMYAFIGILCHVLAGAAAEQRAAWWLRLCVTGAIVVMVAPVLVYGAGWEWLGAPTGIVLLVLQLLTIWLLFSYAGREWAGGPPPAQQDAQDADQDAG